MNKPFLVLDILLFIAIIALGGCSHNNYGSHQADKQVYVLDREIDRAEERVEDLRDLHAVAPSRKLKEEIALEEKNLEALKEERKSKIWNFVSSDEVPKELTSIEKGARLRANHIRRQELVLEKIEENLIAVPNNSTAKGYKVILDNDYSLPVTFAICPQDGGERISVAVAGRSRDEIYLLPGSYSVTYLIGGRVIGSERNLNIDGSVHRYEGEECFGFANMPRF